MIDCYYCFEFKEIEVKVLDTLNPFCSEEEHELWAKKHYGGRGSAKTVREMQERLAKMGKRANLPSDGKLFEDVEEKKVNLDH